MWHCTMRIKAKNVPLGMQPDEAAGTIEEAAPSTVSALPYRLVPVLGGSAEVPAVLIASNARIRPEKAVQHIQQPILPRQAQPGLLSRQQSGISQAENREQQGEITASGRPVRKRKLTTFADDMIPPDALLRRNTKPKGPAPMPPPPPPAAPQQQAPAPRMPVTLPPAAVAATAGGLPAGIKLVTVPTPGGGTVTGLAVTAAALLPALHQHLLRAQQGALSSAQLAAPAQPQQAPAAVGAMPYRLVPAAPAPTNTMLPAVRVAAPRDIVQVAKQLDEEERRKALANADARVVLRVVPGNQAAGKGPKAAAAPAPPAAVGRGGGRGQFDSGGAGRGRGRSGRSSRRPTPELVDRRLDNLPPGTWHPGFEVFGGVTYVNVLQSASAPPMPAVVVGTPSRFSQPLFQDPRPEYDFSDDPLRSSLEFLRHSARTVGLQPHYSGPVQAAVNAEQRLYKERLARAHFARDGRRLAKDKVVEATRKSVRMRIVPEAFLPPSSQQEQQHQRTGSGTRSGKAREAPRPEDATDVRLGEEFQAELPAVQPRPAQPTSEEASWVANLACQAGDAAPPNHDAQQTAAMPWASAEERAAWVTAAHEQLCSDLGEERSAALGLLAMGSDAHQGLLSDEEEATLEAGMREFGRAFHTIQLENVPSRTVFELIDYYYNVWKLHRTPRSRAWYEEKAAEESQRQAELDRQEQAAVAEQEALRQRQEQRYKRRMLREVVHWVKQAARAPKELQNRPVVMQRAQRAAKLIGSMNAA